MAKATSAKSITKSELFVQLAEASEAPKADIKKFYEALTSVILKNLGKKGPGVLTLPGLFKLRSVKKPATKARKGTNPFTGEEMMFKAKPARKIVRARPVKAAKDAV